MANLDPTEIQSLVFDRFGVKVDKVKKGNGFYDNNYHVQESGSSTSYILKFLNKDDSCFPNAFRGISEMVNVLSSSGFYIPKPVRTKDGGMLTTIEIDGHCRVVQLLAFVSGTSFDRVSLSKENFYQVVKEIATAVGLLNKTLQNKKLQYSLKRTNVWWLETFNMETNGSFLKYIQDQELRKICSEIILKYQSQVLPDVHKFRKGLVHGDVNSGNVILEKCNSKIEESSYLYKFHGIIDFCEAYEGSYVFEMATVAAYMMCEATQHGFNAERALLDCYFAYEQIFPLTIDEKQHLELIIAARLVSLVVLSVYCADLQPDNITYIARYLESASILLKQIWHVGDDARTGNINLNIPRSTNNGAVNHHS